MKIKNKKTGEIVEFRYLQSDYVAPLVLTTYENDKPKMYSYNSLSELNAEWEDVPEEPKEYWFISTTGEVHRFEGEDKTYTPGRKQLGNYFETEEKAERAVERLRAWKRLKDNGFRFTGWNGTMTGRGIEYEAGKYYAKWVDDMNLIFEDEE